MSSIVIALDVMGGDHAPDVMIEGAGIALGRHPEVRFMLFGDEAGMQAPLARAPDLATACQIRHTTSFIPSDAKPSQALRRGRDSSMRLAIDAVQERAAQGIVSAGNTGALMAISKFVLRTMPGIERPAIASFVPTTSGESVMLDLGANVECDSDNLVQFAVMGAAFARAVLGLANPSVGLLNVGAEEGKGNDAVRAAAQALRNAAGELPLNFAGFVEGDDITKGTVDVIVTDGFSGNIALKTAEGTAKLISGYFRAAFRSSLSAKLGYILARSAIRAVRERIDPSHYNGGVFLGLNGISVKSHGSADARGVATAIGLAVDMVQQDMSASILEDLAHFAGDSVSPKAAAR